MSWGSILSGYISSQGTAANYASQGRTALTNGFIARNNAYQQAEQLEYSSKQRSMIAAMNMERMSRNMTANADAAVADAGGSGFTSADSGSTNEREAIRQNLQQIADAGMSNAIADSSSRFNATLQRVSGDTSLRVAQNENEYMQRLSRITRRTANAQAILGSAMEVGEMLL